ncbi:MAG: CocE/NonD family hydrolase [Microbacteriaceae bacterium]
MKAQIQRNGFWLAIALVLCLISGIGASLVQTNGGSVTVKDLRWETASGSLMSALLYKPNDATAENPRPAVVVSHGWYNTREMQDLNYVELARRGYVVLAIDMTGHGNSDVVSNEALPSGGIGMYDAVKLVNDLPYVDSSRIGVTGHSNGSLAANLSIALDNAAETQLISSVLIVANDAIYRDAETKEYTNIYGARDVGIFQPQYDEFFYRMRDADGNASAPRDYLKGDNAQSFLNFGVDPAGAEKREAGTVYLENIDGEEAMRVIYSHAMIHPWAHISATEVSELLGFFDQSLEAPKDIDAGSQIWQWKVFFNLLGLIGFGIFLVAFSRFLLQTKTFSSLKVVEKVQAQAISKKSHIWFWGSMVGFTIVSAWSYLALSTVANDLKPEFLPQAPPFFIGLWAAVNGIVAIIFMVIYHYAFGKKNGLDPKASGIIPKWNNVGKSILFSAVVVVAAFALVFIADYFFKTDFRYWVLAIKAFGPDKVWIAFLYLPLFLIYFVANSIALNSINRFTLNGKEWVNTATVALFNALGPIILIAAQYIHFGVTGHLIDGFGGIYSIWLFPVVIILAVAAIVSRKIYRETNNPYIGGIIMASVVTMISVSNTLTIG